MSENLHFYNEGEPHLVIRDVPALAAAIIDLAAALNAVVAQLNIEPSPLTNRGSDGEETDQ